MDVDGILPAGSSHEERAPELQDYLLTILLIF